MDLRQTETNFVRKEKSPSNATEETKNTVENNSMPSFPLTNLTNLNNISNLSSNTLNPSLYNINKIKNRIFHLSPTIQQGFDRECEKNDFNRVSDKMIDLGSIKGVLIVSHKKTEVIYAVKVIHKAKIMQNNLQRQISTEIESLYNLQHPNLLRLLNHFEDEENLYLLFQHNRMFTLCDYIRDNTLNDDAIAIFRIIKELISVLIYLHSMDVYDKELRTDNILLDDKFKVKLTNYNKTEFLFSKSSEKGDDNVRNSKQGKISVYSTPEVIRNEKTSKKSDVWKLGVLLYELLSKGFYPFKYYGQDELVNCILNEKFNFSDGTFGSNAESLFQRMLKANPDERINLNELNKCCSMFFNNIIKNDGERQKLSGISVDNNLKQIEKDESIINNKKNLSLQTFSQPSSSSENVNLKNENEKLKKKVDDLEKENILLKNQILNMSYISFNRTGNSEDSLAYMDDDKMKMEYIKRDRLSKIAEIEEKSQEILEYRSKIRVLENELDLLRLNLSEETEKNETFENDKKTLQNLLENERNEKEAKISLLTDKISNYENKFFYKQQNQTNEEYLKNLSLVLIDSIKEFKDLIHKLMIITHDESELMMKNFKDLIEQKEKSIKEFLIKAKNNFNIDINIKTHSDYCTLQKTNVEKIEWMQKQLNELVPYKLKCINFERTIYKMEKGFGLLNEKLALAELNGSNLVKITKDYESKIDKLKKYIETIENKLSDTKEFITKNCGDKIEDFFLIYKV